MEHPENSPEYEGLTVNSGVGPVSIVNPYLKRGRFARHQLTAGDYVEGILRGNVSILGQAVTLVESTNPSHQSIAQEVIEKCLPYSGNSVRVGISGVPGAGKSTSIDEFGIQDEINRVFINSKPISDNNTMMEDTTGKEIWTGN